MNQKQLNAKQTRERLISAAIKTLQHHSILEFTLDAVAKETGVSKGGLLHHFPSKEALIEGILLHLLAEFEAQVMHYYESDTGVRGRWLRAYVRATFADVPIPYELVTLFMLTIPNHPRLTSLIQENLQQWDDRLLHDGVAPARAQVIQYAADAYWLSQVIGGKDHILDKQSYIAELLALIEEGSHE